MKDAPTPAVLWEILTVAFEEVRDRKGAEFCRKHGVGACRAKLGSMPGGIVSLTPETVARLNVRRAAQETLAAFCRECKGCRLSER